MLEKPYYLGLDMGTNSVGWAVTDQQYNLLKAKKQAMFRIFDATENFRKADWLTISIMRMTPI